MKCKLFDVVNASQSLKKLMGVRYSNFQVTYALVKLSKSIDIELDFFNDELHKLQSKYFIGDSVCTEEDKVKFNEEVNKLLGTEVEIGIEVPVLITVDDFSTKDDYPTPLEMISLEKFVEFK